jgi:hypothetical protein
MIGFLPLILALVHRRRAALAGVALIAALVLGTYGTAAFFSGGWTAYRDVLASHEAYIRNTDSFLAPLRPGLVQVADDFFFRPYRAPAINIAVTLLVAVAVLRRRQWLVIGIFGPFCLFAWLFLDFHSASRFSIAYMPMYAMLAAAGIPRRGRALVVGALVVLMILWTWPALRVVHTTASPPVAALDSVRRASGTLYVDERLAAHAALLLPERERHIVRVVPPFVEDRNAVLVREGASSASAQNFTRDRERLERIARSRYFETAIVSGRRPADTTNP